MELEPILTPGMMLTLIPVRQLLPIIAPNLAVPVLVGYDNLYRDSLLIKAPVRSDGAGPKITMPSNY